MKRSKEIHGKSYHPLYKLWDNIKQRCCNPYCKDYIRYGARGITLCKRWRSFSKFLEDMGERPDKNLTIDRLNNSKGYDKDNCVWASRKQQSRNNRRNKNYTYCGKTQCLMDWAIELNINYTTLWFRIHRGRSFNDAVNFKR